MSGTSTPLVFDGTSAALLPGARVAIAVARWNESVTRRLLAGALHRCAAVGIGAGGRHTMALSQVAPMPTVSLVSATPSNCDAGNGAIDVTVTNTTAVAWSGPNGFTASTVDLSGLAPGGYTITADNSATLLLGAGTRALTAGGQLVLLATSATVWTELVFLTAAS